MTQELDKSRTLDDLHKRSAAGEALAEPIREIANQIGANMALNVRLFPGKELGQVLGCVIDPSTGQCVNYFNVPDPTGNLLSTILKNGNAP